MCYLFIYLLSILTLQNDSPNYYAVVVHLLFFFFKFKPLEGHRINTMIPAICYISSQPKPGVPGRISTSALRTATFCELWDCVRD